MTDSSRRLPYSGHGRPVHIDQGQRRSWLNESRFASTLAAFRSRCRHSEFLAVKFARTIARTAKNRRS
ncbi:hypothetical protein HMPREF9614_00449 [Cutibacterium acnes HL002PA2]|nr:hypothetical protein HMPREF9604_01344 [Cutibacterium acnes HL036PA1]EFS61645.1 hypothetical protein HMPREF9605_00802 [Cutibacterium acnes HL036PA2]EFT05944.1 hypothetical protein HMPREF9614_00449 [Cutibacterium acnes HL002PA2]EFT28744.1 hypothetical protein HMPREF9594_01282 [Cutibacterium acnes HL005PA1]EFT34487.1 hypothetical protein HMPREF9596_00679 [Cutibacterium acnes HL005PA3]EFT55674.1 hypothetical protein HMPREF9610_01291 [Cutibacterium acnes HL027PA2]EGE94326.1 hypothetical protein